MEYKGYTGTMIYNPIDRVFHGRLENVSTHLVTYHGDTEEECGCAFKEAVDEYIELRKEIDGKP